MVPIRRRTVRQAICALSALLLAASLTACGGSAGGGPGSPGGGSDDPAEGGAGDTQTAEPIVRLVSVTYQGQPSYDFSYDESGAPTGHTVYHPVTGDPSQHYTVEDVDADGRPLTFAIENVADGTAATSTLVYDDDGRLVEKTYSSSTGVEEVIGFTWGDGTVTMESPKTTQVYTFDEEGNITRTEAAFSGTTAETNYLEFDDAPNPFTLTGGLMAQVLGANNAIRWAPDAGCEYVEDFTYESGLLVASHAEGCGFTHDYTYEYAEF